MYVMATSIADAGSFTSYFRVHENRSLTVLVTLLVFFQMLIAVSGDAVHITMVTPTPHSAGSSSVSFSCFRSSPDTNTGLSFGRPFKIDLAGSSIQTVTTLPYYAGTSTSITPSAVTQYLTTVSVDSTGLFYCEGSNSGMTTRVYSIIHSYTRRFEPVDGLVTKSINRGEYVALSVSSVNGLGTAPIWRRIRNGTVDQLSSVAGQNTLEITVSSSDVMDGDLYTVIQSGVSLIDNHFGMIRLIVRGCSAGQWGPSACTGICNQCYNGGVCDDETGQCICAPGFSGPNCLTACGVHKFGWACELQCESSPVYSCTGTQFGLPDPYGSSCISGYSGSNCDTACSYGSFGAGCTQTCHCQAGTCNIYTGVCISGCAAGWSGVNCQDTTMNLNFRCQPNAYKYISLVQVTVSWQSPVASGGSGSINVVSSPYYAAPSGIFGVGTHSITYTATDGSGKIAVCNFKIFVILDTQMPTISNCPGPVLTILPQGSTSTTATWSEPTASDNNEVVSTYQNYYSGNGQFPSGVTLVYYTFTDQAGNQATCTFSVTVSLPCASNLCQHGAACQPQDTSYTCLCTTGYIGMYCDALETVNPMISCPPNLMRYISSSTQQVYLMLPLPTASDSSGIISTTSNPMYPNGAGTFGSGTHSITYTVTDGARNQASCSFLITVTFPCESNSCLNGATCQVQQPTYTCLCPNGFSGTNCQTDDEAPLVMGCPDTININLAQGKSDVVVTWTEPSTSETVGISQTETHQPGFRFTDGVTTVQYTFTDQTGNSAHCTFNVKVSALPMFSHPPTVHVEPTSATVTWQPWNNATDTGDGPIIAYVVYFTSMGDSNWVSAGNITNTTQAIYSFLVENLEPGTEYSFSVAAVRDGQGGEGPRSLLTRIQTLPPTTVSTQRSTTSGQTTSGKATGQEVVVVVVVVIVILLLIVVVILTYVLIKKHRGNLSGSKPTDVSTNGLHGKFESSNNLTSINSVENPMIAMDTINSNGNKTPEPQQRPTSSASQMSALESSHQFSGLPFKPSGDMGEREARPLPIPLKDFVEYVHTCIGTGKLRDEWASLPGTDAMYACDESQRPNNKVKNRYRNIPAYDHCRVVLETIDDDPDSDYINACYIKGYLKDKAYIATQGPNPATVQDFWRMVWQENIAVIVNSANLVEDGKSKCVKYWPDKGESATFGSMYIELQDEQMKGEYVVRTMKVANMNKKEIRQIIQYHYIQWPDKDVPKDVTPVLRFIKEFSDALPQDSGPFLVHCSAGVGRTGAVIAIHASLKRARSEKSVDVYNFVSDMRDHRNNTVQTPAQYVFIHLALLEALFATDTSIPESDFKKKLSVKNKKNKMADEFKKLEIITPVPAPERCRHSLAALNNNKNRFSNTIFTEAVRPYLMTPRDDGIEYNYINASFIEGFKARDMFVVTQAPLPNTVIDLWRLIYDYELTSLVMLNPNDPDDEESPQYWPSSGSKDYGPFTVTNVSLSRRTGYIVSHLQVTHRRQQRQRILRHYQFTDWPESEATPKSPDALLRLIHAIENDKQDERQSPILVQCIDGLGRSGVFCTLKNSLDRLRMESDVDIMQTIKVLRLNRPNMVATLILYRFCYEAMGAYIDNPKKFAEEEKEREAIYENMPGNQATETSPNKENIYQNLNKDLSEA